MRGQGQPVLGLNGEKIGTAENVYLDNQTGRPEWVAVKTGLFGSKSALVPLAHAQPDPDGVRVPYDKAQIKSAPHHNPDAQLSEAEEVELFNYYGIPYTGDTVLQPSAAQRRRGGCGRRDPAVRRRNGRVGRRCQAAELAAVRETG